MAKFNSIEIDEPDDKPSYADDVVSVLQTVAGNPAGALLLKIIRYNPKDMKIVPYNGGDAYVSGECNAFARPDKARDAAPEGIDFFLGDEDNPRTRYDDERYRRAPWNARGTGKGSDVTIHFTPDTSNGSSCGNGMYGSQPDEVLFHEMIHGLRQMEGRMNPYPTEDSVHDYDTEEEWLAIVATNIYISAKYYGDKGNTKLRANHHGHHPLRPPLNTSAGFLTDANNLQLANIYYLLEQPLFNGLSLVPSAFNPFRELIRNMP